VLDEPQRGFADPADVAMGPVYPHAFVACAGADGVLVLPLDKLRRAHPNPAETGYHYLGPNYQGGKDHLQLSRHYTSARLATQATRRRLALAGDGGPLVVSNHLADSLTVIDAVALRVLRHLPLGGPPPDAARRGEVLFHSGTMTFQGQFSCA